MQWRLARSAPATRRLGLAVITLRGFFLLLAEVFLRDVVESILGSVHRALWELNGSWLLVLGLLLLLLLRLRLLKVSLRLERWELMLLL